MKLDKAKALVLRKYRKYFKKNPEQKNLFTKQADQSFELASRVVDYKTQMNKQTRKILAEFSNKLDTLLQYM